MRSRFGEPSDNGFRSDVVQLQCRSALRADNEPLDSHPIPFRATEPRKMEVGEWCSSRWVDQLLGRGPCNAMNALPSDNGFRSGRSAPMSVAPELTTPLDAHPNPFRATEKRRRNFVAPLECCSTWVRNESAGQRRGPSTGSAAGALRFGEPSEWLQLQVVQLCRSAPVSFSLRAENEPQVPKTISWKSEEDG